MTAAVSDAEASRKRQMTSPLYELRLAEIGSIESHAMRAWGGIAPPVSRVQTGCSQSMTKPGKMPASTQSTAPPIIAPTDQRSASTAAVAAAERGRPR
jgi:hypothetical protein